MKKILILILSMICFSCSQNSKTEVVSKKLLSQIAFQFNSSVVNSDVPLIGVSQSIGLTLNLCNR